MQLTEGSSLGEGQDEGKIGQGMSTTPPRTSNLLARVITAAFALPVIFAIIWFGGPLVSIAVAAIAVVGVLEFYTLLSMRWRSPATLIGLGLTALFLIGAAFFLIGAAFFAQVVLPVLAAATVVLCLGVLYLKQRQQLKFVGPVMWGGLGAFLIAWPLCHFILLRDLLEGRYWVFYSLATVFAADTGAYFVGKAVGRHKLAPRISPNKTMEGAGGGIAAAVVLGTLAHSLMGLPGALAPIIVLSAIVALVSMLGDLAESYLKRRVGAKESGKLLPGHGGVLDRLDSVVFAVPLVYYYAA